MKYKFEKIDFSYGTMPKDKITYDYGVNYDTLDENEKALFQIAWHGWTPQEIQMIIDKSTEITGTERYKYQVPGSDLMIYVLVEKVYFFDKNNNGEEADFIWSFAEFIDFMEKFKKFVQDNR